ncbi:MAG: substrate-binding domain-containing protein [Oceanospirillaceae bacterium]|nr:substrate-binding domain-containing protein [Oceanospirillaceae bacterium]
MATLKDISEHLSLSVTQVSRALNGHSDVSEATRVRVMAAAKALNYTPNIAARKLVSGRSGIVGLVTTAPKGEAQSSNYLEVVVGLSAQFTKLGMQFLVHIIDEKDDVVLAYERLINSGTIDGFVLVSAFEKDTRIAFLQQRKVPFVVHGCSSDQGEYPFFDIDNYQVAYQLTQHLIEQGHRRIAFINGVSGTAYACARMRGYQDALSAARLPLYSHLVCAGEMDAALGTIATVGMFADNEIKPSAIIANNVLIASGVYSALSALNLSIPEDVSVVAHDDVLPRFRTSAFYPALTVTRSPLSDSWGPLAKFLKGTLDGIPVAKLQKTGTVELIPRASCAAPH